jgi:uncharacterized membrane protein
MALRKLRRAHDPEADWNVAMTQARLRSQGRHRHPAVTALVFSLVFALTFVPSYFLNPKISTIDEVSYLSHAFTLGIDGDMDYGNELSSSLGQLNGATNLPLHAPGSAVVAAPLVALFSVIDRVSGHPVIADRAQYAGSWSFFATLLAANGAFLAGVWLYYRSCRAMGYAVPLLAVLGLCVSTGVIYYANGPFLSSHPFEFVSLAAMVRIASSWAASGRKKEVIRNLVLLLLVSALAVLVRPSNMLVFLTVPLVVRLSKQTGGYRAGTLCGVLLPTAAALLGIGLGLLTIAVVYRGSPFSMATVYGTAAVASTGLASMALSRLPAVAPLVFGSEFGLIWSNPILPFGVTAAFVVLASRRRRWCVPDLLCIGALVAAVAPYIALVVGWGTTASDYGFRYLYVLIPFGFVGVLPLLERNAARHGSTRAAVRVALAVCCALSILSILFYKTSDELWPHRQVNAFGVLHHASVRGYWDALLRAILSPGRWVVAIGKGYIGMVGYPLVANTGLLSLAPEKAQSLYVPLFERISAAQQLQAALTLLGWAAAGWWMSRRAWRQNGKREVATG